MKTLLLALSLLLLPVIGEAQITATGTVTHVTGTVIGQTYYGYVTFTLPPPTWGWTPEYAYGFANDITGDANDYDVIIEATGFWFDQWYSDEEAPYSCEVSDPSSPKYRFAVYFTDTQHMPADNTSYVIELEYFSAS